MAAGSNVPNFSHKVTLLPLGNLLAKKALLGYDSNIFLFLLSSRLRQIG